jgi:hypothetical protein
MFLPDSKVNARTWIYAPRFVSQSFLIGTSNSDEYVWEKPKGISFVYGLVIGPGSGGGGGGTLGGGGGGTPGAVLQFMQPASLVPDRLFILVSKGGPGGAAGANGGYPYGEHGIYYESARYTGIDVGSNRKNYAKSNQKHSSTQSGRNGTGAAAGNGGLAVTTTFCPGAGILGVSNYTLIAGTTGNNGGLTTAGTNAASNTVFGDPAGGAGGGGRSGGAKAGGNVTTFETLNSQQVIWNRALSGGAATGAAGENGFTTFDPMFYTLPGAGGGANDAGAGGRGGDGGIGCGGGGGGAGSTVGGAGGNGGDGLVILTCW